MRTSLCIGRFWGAVRQGTRSGGGGDCRDAYVIPAGPGAPTVRVCVCVRLAFFALVLGAGGGDERVRMVSVVSVVFVAFVVPMVGVVFEYRRRGFRAIIVGA